jgi:hypothetical protein
MLFHSPQAGQRPIHLGLSAPQALQNQTVLFFVVLAILIQLKPRAKIVIFRFLLLSLSVICVIVPLMR